MYDRKEYEREYDRQYSERYHKDNKEKISKYTIQYYKKNRVKMIELQKIYYKNNKEKIDKKKKKYQSNNRDKINKRQRRYYQNHKDMIKGCVKKYELNNKDKVKENNKRYILNNKDKVNKYFRVYTKNRRKNDISYKIRGYYTSRIHHSLKSNSKSKKTMELIGCSIEELKQHLESKFTFGMNWKNYGFGWHIDHIKPCYKFDLSKPQEQKKCFCYTNLRPLWATENLSRPKK